jgi:hypothetical protein
MRPLRISLNNKKNLMVIPDTEAHLDGHPVLTYSYGIYLDNGQPFPEQGAGKNNELHLTHHHDPNYRGELIFEIPGKLFNYHMEGTERLNRAELDELIGSLSELRNDPASWKDIDNL